MTPRSIMFLTGSLELGGAERQLLELASGLHRSAWSVTVVSCVAGGEFRHELARLGIPVFCVDKRGLWDIPFFLWRLRKVIAAIQPLVVHGYGTMPNVALALLRPFLRDTLVVWGVRNARRDGGLAAALGPFLSRYAHLIICNSEAGRARYLAQGYAGRAMTVVKSGIDVNRFLPDAAARRDIRLDWGISEEQRLVGYVSRLVAIKDHSTFLRAAQQVALARNDVRFVCVGDGPTGYGQHLRMLAAELGLKDKMIWAGARTDMERIYNALDLAVSSSTAEGCPNAVAEAMATGVPCVATDVGDTANLVADLGTLCPPRQSGPLAEAIVDALSGPPGDATRIRQRICEHYSSVEMVADSSAHIEEALRARQSAPGSAANGRRQPQEERS